MSNAVARDGLEKSSVSRAIRDLEKRVDGVICERGPGGFRVTDYGRAVYSAAIIVDDSVEAARQQINAAHNTYEGEVRLGISDNCLTNPSAKISDAIELFISSAPAVKLSVSIHPPDRLASAVIDRRVHLGIMTYDLLGSGFSHEPLFLEEFRLWCCPHDGETPPHLDKLAARGFGIVQRNFETAGPSEQSLKIKAAWAAHASGIEAVATLINTGRCVGFLPVHYVLGTRTRRPFVEVPGSAGISTPSVFCVVNERARPMTQAVRAMHDALVGVAKRAGSFEEAAKLLGWSGSRPL